MLVLSRKIGQRITIGGGIVITVVSARGCQVRLGVEAPQDVVILREELSDPVTDITEETRPAQARTSGPSRPSRGLPIRRSRRPIESRAGV